MSGTCKCGGECGECWCDALEKAQSDYDAALRYSGDVAIECAYAKLYIVELERVVEQQRERIGGLLTKEANGNKEES